MPDRSGKKRFFPPMGVLFFLFIGIAGGFGIYYFLSDSLPLQEIVSNIGQEKKEHTPHTGSLVPEGFTNSLGMKFVYIKPGTFTMGSKSSESGRYYHERRRKKNLIKGYYLQTTEVTQGQWKQVMGSNPSGFKGDNLPVESLSWNDVQEFIKKMNHKGGKITYRLPTEAEWEYAARAGTTTSFAFGDCLSTDQANYDGNYPLPGCSKGEYRKCTTTVGSFPPNAWGFYDMHGNVGEWCQDRYREYPSGSVVDPLRPSSGADRVVRGGGWSSFARYCRSAYRNGFNPGSRIYYVGFRLAGQ